MDLRALWVFSPGQKQGVKSKQKSVPRCVLQSEPHSEGIWENSLRVPDLGLISYLSQHSALLWSDWGNWLPCLHCKSNSHCGIYFAVRNINPLHPQVQIDYKSAFCWHWHICESEYIYMCVWAFKGGVRDTQRGGNGSHTILATL